MFDDRTLLSVKKKRGGFTDQRAGNKQLPEKGKWIGLQEKRVPRCRDRATTGRLPQSNEKRHRGAHQ